MSTTYEPIPGLLEVPIPATRTSDYFPAELHVSRFFGGKGRGVSIQLGITLDSGDYNDIQLDNRSAHKLLEILRDALGHVGANGE